MTKSPATRGFLFADLRDYTRFVEAYGDEAAARLLKSYRAVMREVIGRYGAAEIKTEGDSFYVVFPSASGAIEGGLAILEAAKEATSKEPSRPIHVGIGVHAGETEETGEGPVGLAVNIAARVCARAKPGELLVTDTVRSLTRTRMSVRFVPRGSQRLKGIGEPIALYAVVPGAESEITPTRRLRGTPFAIGAAVLASIAILAFVQIVTRPTAPSPGLDGLPCAAASATPPPVADVPAYRADVARTSVYPGPGPQCQPTVVWQRQLGAVANFVPIVISGQVIVGDQDGLHAYDARTGEPGWTFPGSGGFAESALADQGVIYAADLDGTLHAIEATTGAERWNRPLANSGIHPTLGAGLMWVGSSDGHAYGLDPSTGAVRWKWDVPSGNPADVSVVTDQAAYVVSGGALYAIRLVDRAELWHYDTGSTRLAGPTIGGDSIYIAAAPPEGGTGGGALFAIDLKTGASRLRPFAIASGAQVTPGPFRGGILYVTTNGDGVYALRDTGSEYEVVWHNPNVSWSFRPASLVGNLLYVQQTESSLIALRADTGELVWQAPAAMPAEEPPIVTGGLIFQVDAEGSVLRAWAEPGLAAMLGASISVSPSPSQLQAPNPFAVIATFPWFETGIQVPAAMDIGPDGLLYVLHAKADYSDPRVTIIDPKTGRPIASWGRSGSGPGELDLTTGGGNVAGGCIAIAPDGLLYIGERGNRRIEVFTGKGKVVRQIGEGKLGAVLDCGLGPDDSLYTVEDESGLIAKFSSSGKLVWRQLLDPAQPAYAFQVHGITVRRDGKIIGFVDATGEAVILNPRNGHVVQRWGEPGNEPGELGLSGEPTLDSKGNVYVFQYVPQALQVFDPTGHFLGGIYEEAGAESGFQFDGEVFWPPPVFAKDGFAYSFGPDGLIRLKVSLSSD